jgi:hypothetical protein
VNPTDVVIIGAGISGLTAAFHFQKAGITCEILEKSGEPGGRIKTIQKNGFTLDVGFQVLHPNYPEVRNSGVWESLIFSPFQSGALISREKNLSWYSNPLLDPLGFIRSGLKFPFPLAEIPAAIRLFKAAILSDEDFLLSESNVSCRQYLLAIGISEKSIQEYFVPFFGGVFLDTELKAGYGYFLWLFKKFMQGKPGLPMGGMQRLPMGMAALLPARQHLHLGVEVKGIENGLVLCRDGRSFKPKFILDAAGLTVSQSNFLGTRNYYFEGPVTPSIPPSLILNGNPDGDILHFCFPSAVQQSYAPDGRALCSVTLRDHIRQPEPESILKELALLFPSNNWKNWNFLESFHVQKAITAFSGEAKQFYRRKGSLFIAGDAESYPSINGAMRSGREVAEVIIRELSRA